MLITLITLILIVATFVIIVLAKNFENKAESFSPQIDCPDTEVSQEDALTDQ